MIAVTQIGGHQAIVKKGEVLSVDKIDAEVGKTVEFPVLLVSDEDGKDFQLGTPILSGVTVKAKIIEHSKDDKIKVYKMTPKKRYRRTYGHRTHLTKIEITDIKVGGSTKKEASEPKASEKSDAPVAKKAPAKKVEKNDQ
ncbi:MAG TPA: 50S ribosomal protein L21 [Candidatus Gracilibacteria bacterium]